MMNISLGMSSEVSGTQRSGPNKTGFYFKKYSHDLMLQIKGGLLTLFEVMSCFSGFFCKRG